MGRNKKAKKTHADCESDVGSDVQEEQIQEVTQEQEDPAADLPEVEEGGKKDKKLSKKALQRMEQQKRASEAPPPKKGKGKKRRGDTSSDEESEDEKVETSKSAAVPAPVAEPIPDSESDAEASDDDDIPPAYPIKVTYCPNCTFPIEMCEFSGMFDKCKPFLIEILGEEAVANITDKGRKRKIATEAEKLEAMLTREGKNKLEKHVVMEIKSRGNGRFLTYVRGLDLFGVNMKEISKDFKKTFATGAGVTSEPGKLDAVEIQGEFVDQIAEIIMKRFGIPKDAIYKQDGKNTYPLFGPKPEKKDDADAKKKKKATGKMAMEQQAPDFESGDRITKSKIIVAEKKEKVVKEEPERVRLFGPKVTAGRGGGAGGRGGCFNCGQDGHISKDCPAPRAPRGGGGAGRGADAGRGRGEGRGRGAN